MSGRGFGSRRGGGNGQAVWWPAGLEAMTPRERVIALQRGWWPVGDGYVITRDGRRLYRPVEAAAIETRQEEKHD